MTTEPEVIDCAIIPLPTPLRLGSPGFVTSLRTVEGLVAKLQVVDVATMQEAADLQGRLTKAGVWLEETRAKLKAPVLEQAKLIDAAARGPMDRIEAAKRTLKAGLLAYNTKQLAIASAAEAARRAELARLEGIRQAEAAKAAETARLAAIEAAKLPVAALKLEDDVPTETEKAIEAVKLAPVVVAPKAAGLSFKVTLAPMVTDIMKIPDLFIERTVKLQAIRATFCTGWREGMEIPECPGVKFEVRRDAVTR